MLLLHGDCLKVMRDLSDNTIDCFVCDLPYGCLTGGAGKEKTRRAAANPAGMMGACAWDVKIDLDAFWVQVKRLAKSDNVPVLMFCNTKFGNELINSNPGWFRYDIVWAKTNAVGFLRANKSPMTCHEMIYVFSKKGAFYKRIDISGNFPPGGGGRSTANFMPISGMPNLQTTEAGRRCVTSVVTMANKKEKGGHPTQKPIELYKWLLERYCPAGGTVLDPTAGSFHAVAAAEELGLHGIGIEKDRLFFDKAKKKYAPI
jgi:site-specific DNA-methyltransferase (adenine-specific)